VVAAGLASMSVGLVWTAAVGSTTGYLEIACQMLFLGGGLGLTSAPATASIMDVLPPAKAGVGSAVNDTTRQVGGTLGVAVIGSAFSSVYADSLTHSPAAAGVPADLLAAAKQSFGAALPIAARLPGEHAALFAQQAQGAFLDGLTIACYLAGTAALAGAIAAAVFLPGRRHEPALDTTLPSLRPEPGTE